MTEGTQTIEHDLEKDQVIIRTINDGVLHSEIIDRRYLAGSVDNNINTLYRSTARYGLGLTDPRQYQNAYKPKKFPRSEGDMDAIMLRRVNARQQLAQEKIVRHWKHVAIVSGVVIFSPLLVAAVLRMWGFALAWIAS